MEIIAEDKETSVPPNERAARLRLLQRIGFVRAGRWLYSESRIRFELHDDVAKKKYVLYAFAVDGGLSYIGKTENFLQVRMQRYKTPPHNGNNGGTTNRKNHRNIFNALVEGYTVDIFAMCDFFTEEQCNLPADPLSCLENLLIQQLSPPWNG